MSPRKQLFVAMGSALAVTVLAVTLWSVSVNKSSISKTSSNKPAPQAAYKLFNDGYIAFSFKSTYMVQKLPAANDDLDVALLSASTNFDKHLAVSVSRIPNGTLDSNSAYILRKTQLSVYAASQVLVDGATATLYAKRDGTEQTVFMPHGDKVAVLAFTTSGNEDNLTPEVSDVLQTLHWERE